MLWAVIEVVFTIICVLLVTALVGLVALAILDVMVGCAVFLLSTIGFWAVVAFIVAWVLYQINMRNLRARGEEVLVRTASNIKLERATHDEKTRIGADSARKEADSASKEADGATPELRSRPRERKSAREQSRSRSGSNSRRAQSRSNSRHSRNRSHSPGYHSHTTRISSSPKPTPRVGYPPST